MEVVTAAAAPEAVPAAPAQTPAPAAAPVVPEAPKPDRTFTQTELDDILEKRLSKERRKREDIERRLRVTEDLALRRGELEKQAQPEQPRQPQKGQEPRRDVEPWASMPYENFVEERAEWRADRKVDERFAKDREERDRQRQTDEAKKAGDDFRKRMKDTAKEMPDFDEVIAEATASADMPVSRIAADPIAAADNPAKILYHLSTNPEEAERIASLPLGQQAREIWKLDVKLATEKPAIKASQAPEPIKPVGGGKTAVGDEMPDAAKNPDKWMEWRKRQIAAKKSGGARA